MLSEKHGFCKDVKAYKENPEGYKGHVGDVSMILRVAVCGHTNSPDMYSVFKILGKERLTERIDRALKEIK